MCSAHREFEGNIEGKSRRGDPVDRVSIKDVATRAGVSVGTVSNVLNHPGIVTDKTRQRVNDSIRDLKFVRNESARQLRAGRSRTIGLVVLDVTNPFFTDIARGVEDAANNADVALILCNSDGAPEKEHRYLTMLAEQRVLGVLIVPLLGGDQPFPEVVDRSIPLVVVDVKARKNDRCSVSVDDVEGGFLATSHLIRQGHRKIAFVGGSGRPLQVESRFKGARKAIAQGSPGLQLIPITVDEMSVAGGRSAGDKIMEIPGRQRPTAAFCSNDLLALGLLQTLTDVGAKVPEDLAIVGYDDIEFAGAATVPLSSVRQPSHKLGYEAARLLLDEAASDDHKHQHVVYSPELIVRRSSDLSWVRRPNRF